MALMVQLKSRRAHLLLILALLPLTLAAETGGTGPVVIRFEISDANGIDRSVLRSQAAQKLDRLAAGEGSPADLADAVYSMQSWLVENGRPDARITSRLYSRTPQGQTEIDTSDEWRRVNSIVIEVNPGEQVRIGRVEFRGNSSYPDERLAAYLNTGRDLLYVKRKIETGAARIRRFYRLNGFAECTIDWEVSDRRTTEAGVYHDISLELHEGTRFRIANIDIQGEDLSSEERARLQGALDLIGRPYFPRLISEGALTLHRELGRFGYDAVIERSSELQQDGRVRVSYQVEKGPEMVIDSVEIVNTGSSPLRSRSAFLLSFFPQREGETVDFSLLNRTESRLYSLGIFAFVDVETRELSDRGDPRPVKVLINLEELSSQYLELQAGWNSYELLRGSATFIDRNLFGLGRRFSFSLLGSFKTYGAESSISDTLLLGQGSTMALTGSYRHRISPSFTLTTMGGELSVAYQLDPAFGVRGAYEYSRSLTDDIMGEIAGTEDEDFSTGRLRFSAAYDTRDSILFPRQGEYLQTSAFLAPELLGSDIGFYGGDAEVRFHVSGLKRVTFSTAGDYRFRARIASSDALPIQERLFLGGSDSVRSFGEDQLGQINPAGTPLGGMSSLEATAELRIRLAGSLYAALYYDAGILSPESFSLTGDFGHGPGAGVQYNLPIGPIRFDLAYNPGRLYAAGSRWMFHFGVGLSY